MADRTQYRFEGTTYSKRKLVEAIFNELTATDNYDLASIAAKFDQNSKLRKKLITEEEFQIKAQSSNDNLPRYFEEPLKDTQGESWYLRNQWGINDIDFDLIWHMGNKRRMPVGEANFHNKEKRQDCQPSQAKQSCEEIQKLIRRYDIVWLLQNHRGAGSRHWSSGR